jgi:hypothetical protein
VSERAWERGRLYRHGRPDDPHRYRLAGITKLSVAILERAIRDSQLVETGHRVKACPLENWPDSARRSITAARAWLVNPDDPMLRLWASGAGLEAAYIAASVQKRLTWTERLEERAKGHMSPPNRHQRWPSPTWPFRRVGDEKHKNVEE